MSPAGWELEGLLWESGLLVAGVDEAGRGPLAGPVVAAAVIFPPGCTISCLEDSKCLTATRRQELALLIEEHALAAAWAAIDVEVIDTQGLLGATFQAMVKALRALSSRADFVLVDGPRLPPSLTVPARAVVRGDGRCASIAAASILAKVARDRLMLEIHAQFPHYGFAQHKGYATKAHLAALAKYGPCPAHRRSFRPVRELRLGFAKDWQINPPAAEG